VPPDRRAAKHTELHGTARGGDIPGAELLDFSTFDAFPPPESNVSNTSPIDGILKVETGMAGLQGVSVTPVGGLSPMSAMLQDLGELSPVDSMMLPPRQNNSFATPSVEGVGVFTSILTVTLSLYTP